MARVRPAAHLRVLDLQPRRPSTRAEAEHLLRELGRRAVRQPASEAASVGKPPFSGSTIATIHQSFEALIRKEKLFQFEAIIRILNNGILCSRNQTVQKKDGL